MARIDMLAPSILKWEGGFVNDPVDKGGATNMGVTLATWRQVGYDKDGDRDIDAADMKLLTKGDFTRVLRLYWDRWNADQIKDQQIANILVDWVWGSGRWGVVIPQRLLGVKDDGLVGDKTLEALNKKEPKAFHKIIWDKRLEYLHGLVSADASQKRFINGWVNRLNDFKWKG